MKNNGLKAFEDTDIYGSKRKKEKKNNKNVKKGRPAVTLKQSIYVIRVMVKYLEGKDFVLMVLGLVCAVVNGLISPASSYILGQVVNYILARAAVTEISSNLQSTYYFYGKGNSSLESSSNFFNDVEVMKTVRITNLNGNALYYLIIGAISLLTAFFEIYCLEIACDKMVSRLRKEFLSQVLRQDLEWFDKAEEGDLSTRLTDDLERVRDGFGAKVALLTQLTTMIISGFVVGFYLEWRLALVLCIATPLLFANAMMASSITAQTAVVEQIKYSEAGGIASEVLTSIRTVAAFGAELISMNRYNKALNEGRKLTLSKYYGLAVSIAVSYGSLMIMYSLGLWYGSYLFTLGYIDPGTMTSVFSCLVQAAFTAALCMPMLVDIGTAIGSAASIIPTILRHPHIDPYSDEGLKPLSMTGNIEFNGVTFSYPTRPNMKVLKGMDLKIPAGKIIALVGPSGAGKSTIVGLLMRFYDVSSGTILIDQVPVKDLNVKWLREHIGIVSQEPILFRASIAENIRYGRHDASMDDIINAAKLANAHNYIKLLPQGYETEVGDRGTQLSGGQKQRIAIARALVRDPKVLLLDEATSALDSESEAVVQAALDNAMLGRTTIIVAHRLSTIRNANIICAMKDGLVHEMGSHEELMEKKGLYFDLVNLQNKMDDDNSPVERIESKPLKRLSSINSSISLSSEDRSTQYNKAISLKSSYAALLKVEGTPWGRIFFGISLFILCGLAEPILAIIYTNAVQAFLLSGNTFNTDIIQWVIGLGCLGLIVALFLFTGVMLCATSTERLVQLVRVKCFRNMLSQQAGWFDEEDNMPNRLTNTLARDPPLIKGIAGGKIGMLMKCSLNIIFAIGVSYYSDWRLAFLTLGVFLMVILSTWKSLRLQVRTFYKESELVQMGFQLATECIQNIETVQQIGLQQFLISKYIVLVDKASRSAVKQAIFYGMAYTMSSALIIFLNAALCKFGSMLLENGQMEPSNLLRLIFLGSFTTPVIPAFSHFFNEFAKAVDPIKNISRLLTIKNVRFDTFNQEGIKPQLTGQVTFKKIRFSYPTRREAPILRGLVLTVEPGKTVALVGSSGCGKSTLISLLERFYSPNRGKIYVDNQEITSINLAHLRSQMGLVTQEPTLFDCSIKENIAYGALDKKLTDEEIYEAARMANIHDFIISLPKGYDTEVGDRGAQMSGGQKQRIAIARALVRNPKILLLDEATSALDNQSEKVVQAALEKAQIGRTCIVIAHRLSTIQSADKIVVVANGTVAEQGNHSQLMQVRGKYYEMVMNQQRGGSGEGAEVS